AGRVQTVDVDRGHGAARIREPGAMAVPAPPCISQMSATGYADQRRRDGHQGGAMDDRTALWNELAAQLAVDSIRCSTAAGSGHPTSSMSSAHLLAVLYADHLRYDVNDPHSPANDRFVISKGHAS